MLASVALASASRPLRAASITRFTASMSAADVDVVGATAKGPAAGRASGLKWARVSKSAPRSPTLACAYEERPEPLASCLAWGCRAATGVAAWVCCAAGGVACLAVFSGGRGRGNGTFCAVAENDSAHSPQEAAKAKRMLKRLRPVAIIKPRAVGPRRPESARGRWHWPIRPKILMDGTQKLHVRETT